jgi:hypothetical protein
MVPYWVLRTAFCMCCMEFLFFRVFCCYFVGILYVANACSHTLLVHLLCRDLFVPRVCRLCVYPAKFELRSVATDLWRCAELSTSLAMRLVVLRGTSTMYCTQYPIPNAQRCDYTDILLMNNNYSRQLSCGVLVTCLH